MTIIIYDIIYIVVQNNQFILIPLTLFQKGENNVAN